MSSRNNKGKPLPPDLLAKLRGVAAELGEQRLVADLGLNTTTVARAVSGFEVYPGTVAAIRLLLADRDKAA